MSKGRIVFTGFRNKSLEEKLEAGGFEVSETLTKDTYALIVPVEGYSSSKVDKAEKYGVTILSVNQLLNGDIVK
jgi:NAD-dependent DNA ligase